MSLTRTTMTKTIFQLCEQGALTALKTFFTDTTVLDYSNLDFHPFHYAINHPEIIAFLTDDKLRCYDRFGDNTKEIHANAFAGRTDEVLAAISADINNLVLLSNEDERKGYHIFYWAALGNHFDLVDKLLNLYLFQVINSHDLFCDIFKAGVYLAQSLIEMKKYNDAQTLYEKLKSYLAPFEMAAEAGDLEQDSLISELIRQVESIKKSLLDNPPIVLMFNQDVPVAEVPIEQATETADHWGFYLHWIPNDGNCLFRALSHQIQINRDLFPPNHRDHNHETLRKLAVQHLSINEDIYKSFAAASGHQSDIVSPDFYSEYLAKMAKLNEWGDQLTILALIAELKFSVAILMSDQSAPPIILKSPVAEPVANLYIMHTNAFTHFHSTVIKDNEKVRIGINEIINQSVTQEVVLFATSVSEYPSPDAEEVMSDIDDHKEADNDDDLQIETDPTPELLKKFELMSQIADDEIPFQQIESIIADYCVSEIEVYLMRNDWDVSEAILVSDPWLFTKRNRDSQTPFYRTVLIGNYAIIDLLTASSGFYNLTAENKNFCFMDAAKGAIDRGDVLLNTAPENSVKAYETARAYVAIALNSQPSNKHCHKMLNEINAKLIDALEGSSAALEAKNMLEDAIKDMNKLISLFKFFTI
jgi:tetratricopeptide (TPR) repeat protein